MSTNIYNNTKPQFGVIYLITNLKNVKENKNPKYYIGSKKYLSEWEKGEYYGSSRILTEDIDTLGKKHFKREILQIIEYIDYKELLEQEHSLISEKDAVFSEEYYNKAIYTENFFIATEKVYEKRSKGIFTDAEIESHNKEKLRKANGQWTAAELDAYNKRSERKKSGKYTEAELTMFKRESERRQNGNYTKAELNSFKKESVRKKAGIWTKKEINARQKINKRKSKKQWTEAERDAYRICSERRQQGLWTDAELAAHKSHKEKMSGRTWINNGVESRNVKGNLLSELLNEDYVLGRLPCKKP